MGKQTAETLLKLERTAVFTSRGRALSIGQSRRVLVSGMIFAAANVKIRTVLYLTLLIADRGLEESSFRSTNYSAVS